MANANWGEAAGRSVGSTKGEQNHAKGSQNPNRNGKFSGEAQNPGWQLGAGSDSRCCVGELSCNPAVHTQESRSNLPAVESNIRFWKRL